MNRHELYEMLNTALIAHSSKITNWERDFISKMIDQMNGGKGLSKKQGQVCEKILKKTGQLKDY